MGLINLLFTNPALFIILAVVLLYSVILHEIAHGYTALLFGDRTAQINGRLSLNPASHIDPIGMLMLFFVGFGWARPVPIDYYLVSRNRFGFFCVALAGCFTNILIATLGLVLLQFETIRLNPIYSLILTIVVQVNIMLGAFNLIPIPPLDGSKILMSIISYPAQERLARLEPYGFFILIILLLTGILNPIITIVKSIILLGISLFIGIFKVLL